MRRFRFGFVFAPVMLALLLAGVRQLSSQPQPNQPRPAQRVRIPDDVEVLRDIKFGKGGEKALKLDIVRPKEPPLSITANTARLGSLASTPSTLVPGAATVGGVLVGARSTVSQLYW